MTSLLPTRPYLPHRRPGRRLESPSFVVAVALALLASKPTSVHAQVSLTSAVALAQSTSPRVLTALDDVKKAQAALAEARSVYVPTVLATIDIGDSAGPPLGDPKLFSIDANSLIFSASQRDYIRSATAGLEAAKLTLEDTREAVAEDAAVTYLNLDSAQQRRAALVQQFGFADRLATIIQQRLDAGQDTRIELIQARRTLVQIRLQVLQLDNDIDTYRSHLTRLDGLPNGPLATDPGSIPALPEIPKASMTIASAPLILAPEPMPDTPAVAAAFANAHSKQEQAFGEARYVWRPQVSFFAQYSRFTTFDNTYAIYYPAFGGINGHPPSLNATGFGVQITVPFYDRTHAARALQAAADAQHAQHQAVYARDQMFEGRLKLQHASAELSLRTELADDDQQIAQQQLDVILVQLQAGNGSPSAPQLTPKDEQNARIQERQRYLDLLDAKAKLRETQVQLLRLTGQLDTWLKSAIPPSPNAPTVTLP